MGEAEELEDMRGAKFLWREHDDVADAASRVAKKMEKEMIKKMTALERYHLRKERKMRREVDGKKGYATKKHGSEEGGDDVDDDDDDEEEEEKEAKAKVEYLNGPFITRRIKVRSVEHKSWQRLDPPGGGSYLFGWHTVPHNAADIIITEGEFDAMAVYQATGRPAVSLPNGCRSFPTDMLVLMERFDTVYIWMNNDGPGQEGAETFARKLGVEQCLIFRPSSKRSGGVSPQMTIKLAMMLLWTMLSVVLYLYHHLCRRRILPKKPC